MDIYQKFKSFLGLPTSKHTDNDQINREEYNNGEEPRTFWKSQDERGNHHLRHSPDQFDSFGFNVFSNPLEMHRYFEHNMNEILKNFGIFANEDSYFDDFRRNSGGNPPQYNGIEMYQFPSIEDFNNESQARSGSLRDQFLKPGYESIPHGQLKADQDLDEKFNMKELDTVLQGTVAPVKPRMFFYGQSVTSKTIRNADGTIESHKTIRDQNGNEETIITKRQGDVEYSVTTKRNKDGAQQVIENMVNLDENEKENFLKSYHKKLTDTDVKSPSNDFPYDKFF